jgi:hypothetical protein
MRSATATLSVGGIACLVAVAGSTGRKCHGGYAGPELSQYLSRARVALWLPSTRAVAMDPDGRCVKLTVASEGAGRLAELVLRGMAVPRNAVVLEVVRPEPRRQ